MCLLCTSSERTTDRACAANSLMSYYHLSAFAQETLNEWPKHGSLEVFTTSQGYYWQGRCAVVVVSPSGAARAQGSRPRDICSSKIFHCPQLSNWTHIWKVLVVIFRDDFFVSSFVCFLSCLNQCECFELLPFWRRMKLLHWWITSHMLSIEIYMCNLRNQFVFVAKTRSLSVLAGATFPVDRGTIGLPFPVGKIINPTWLK